VSSSFGRVDTNQSLASSKELLVHYQASHRYHSENSSMQLRLRKYSRTKTYLSRACQVWIARRFGSTLTLLAIEKSFMRSYSIPARTDIRPDILHWRGIKLGGIWTPLFPKVSLPREPDLSPDHSATRQSLQYNTTTSGRNQINTAD
jgi:hypothetical protein